MSAASNILRFPTELVDARERFPAFDDSLSAKILILPVVRAERPAEEPKKRPLKIRVESPADVSCD